MKLLELYESTIASKHVGSAMTKIVSYLERELDIDLRRIPGVEHYKNSLETGYGIRYVIDGSTKAIRFNWISAGKSDKISSIDYWLGNKHDPNFHIEAPETSFVKILPTVANLLQKPKIGTYSVIPSDDVEALTEAKRGDFTPEAALDDFFVSLKKASNGLTRTDFIVKYHITNSGLFDTLVYDFGDRFEIAGKRVMGVQKGQDIEKLKKLIIAKADVQVHVKAGGSNETYEDDDDGTAMTADGEKVSFIDTLTHLESLTTALIKGSFNALFVAGKGGTGKTQTVEDVLAQHGLEDGHGYYKNTGTASANGMYRLLYKYRNKIILFDDSDGALADQDGRNLIKAATDTKKVRKLAWSKATQMTDEDGGDIPKEFEFTGRIIFISNLQLGKLDPDGALRTRAFIIAVNPTPDEIIQRMEQIVDKIELEDGLKLTKAERREVLNLIKSLPPRRKEQLSLRTLVRSLNIAASHAPNWKTLVELYA